jgi:hypothetical protein
MRLSVLLACLTMGGLMCLQGGTPPSMCRVTLTLTDAQSGAEIPGLVRILDAEGRAVQSSALLSRGLGLTDELPIQQWLVVPRALDFDLPRGAYTISAISGLETEQAQLSFDLTHNAQSQISIPLRRFYDAAKDRYHSGNTHLHLMKVSRETADRYLTEVPRADRLDLLFLSYLERAGADQDYISNRYTSADLARLSRASGTLLANGEEHRHNFTGWGEGYGHVMFLKIQELIQPVSIGPGIMKAGDDGLPLARGIETARRQGASVIWCHNEWGLEALPNWFSGRIDAQNIFDGSTRSSYKDSFYRYLNAGLRVPFSTGTDWFMYDFSRVYVQTEGKPTAPLWLEGLAAGRSFITNGPLLSLRVAGKTPGDALRLERPEKIEVVGRASGRIDFERLELVQNGQVVSRAATRAAAGHFESELTFSIDVQQPCWFALRTPSPSVKDDPELQQQTPKNEFGQELFAHTSPVYVELAGHAVFDRETARQLLEKMKSNRQQVIKSGRFDDDLAKARVLDVYDEAIALLEKRLQ